MSKNLEEQAQEEKAADELLKLYSRSVYNTLFRITGDADAAEHLTQETFLRAFSHIDNLQNKSNPAAWINAIARKVAVDHFRLCAEIDSMLQQVEEAREATRRDDAEMARLSEETRRLVKEIQRELNIKAA